MCQYLNRGTQRWRQTPPTSENAFGSGVKIAQFAEQPHANELRTKLPVYFTVGYRPGTLDYRTTVAMVQRP